MTKLLKILSLIKAPTNSHNRFMTCAVSQADATRIAGLSAYS